ncbi:MAG: hypothetical protein J5931_00235 [Prevotella sp.]|nr:hypothetical protein [Prevotella sp.]
MAEKNCITLKIYVPLEQTDILPVDASSKKADCLAMSTGSKKAEGYVQCNLSSMGIKDPVIFMVNILDVSFTKKMYQPNVITTKLYMTRVTTNTNDKSSDVLPSKAQIIKTFLNKKVEMFCNDDSNLTVCNDYYVQNIEPHYTKSDLYVSLTIYSPDYQMTIDKYCRTFVAKKLSAILKDQKANFAIPYLTTYKDGKDKDGKPTGKKEVDKSEPVKVDCANMQQVVKNSKEHIFPYLVQYNESYYDFLKRTTNRWGEFLYYEDGQLNVGFKSTAPPKEVNEFASRSYQAIDASAILENKTGMDIQATADANMLNNPMTKGLYDVVKGEINSIGKPDKAQDKYIMKKISSLFGNNKPLGTWTLETVVDDLVALGVAEKKSNEKNKDFDKKYFEKTLTDAKPEQYDSSKNKYNQFSEFTPLLGAADYGKILKMELNAGHDAMKIDFSTSFPNLKLGQIIKVSGEEYLVVEFRGYQPNNETVQYEATCLAKCKIDDKNSAFFPPYLSTGHILESGIQHATVTDAGDPLRANRVRVKFGWQGDKDEASPWLLFAQNAATKGSGVHGRHYKGENVLVDFINGNIERPYVIGAVNQDPPATLKTSSITMTSPAGHGMCVTDGSGAGLTAFLAGITPGLKTIQGMLPGKDITKMFDEKQEVSKRFEGSTEITDYYGIYSIKGSTDGRNITIKSAWGDVQINAFTGITVSAPNGDIKLQGKNVTIEAGNNLKLISGSNVKNKFISRASSNHGESFAAAMGDAGLIVAKKLQDLSMSLFDLSLVRNMIEVGFKPQEGLLEIQSNRFLKLEAGGAKAGYPLNAYASIEKKEEEYKKDIKNMLNMAPAIVGLLDKIAPCVKDFITNYVELFRDCAGKKREYVEAYNGLCRYSNTRTNFCKDYNQLIPLLWNENTKEIKESDMGFNDAEVGDAENAQISAQCEGRGRLHFYTFNTEANQRKHVLSKRKEHKKDVLEKANALLKSIQDFRKVRLMNYQKTYDVGYFYGTFTRFVPKDYLDAFKKAFEIERLKGTYYYDNLFKAQEEGIKSLTYEHLNAFDDDNHKLALMRKVALNLMADWGIKDQNRPPQVEGNVPLAPAIKKPEKEDELLGDLYTAYVRDLTIKDGKIVEKDTGVIGNLAKTALEKFDPTRPIREYYSWGSPKDGAILFSDKSTFQLGQQIKAVETKFAGGKFKVADLGDETIRKVEDFMVPIRAALHALGVE